MAFSLLASHNACRTDGRALPCQHANLAAFRQHPAPVHCGLPTHLAGSPWPSPAVAGDSQCVFLCDQADGFAWRPLPYDLAGPRDNVEADVEAGA